ncbi:hypothetical protein AaE_002536, partial [Aphanomyces astaci]
GQLIIKFVVDGGGNREGRIELVQGSLLVEHASDHQGDADTEQDCQMGNDAAQVEDDVNGSDDAAGDSKRASAAGGHIIAVKLMVSYS